MIRFKDEEFCEAEVAILMASYNGEKYILDQLESINKQTYQKYICFIHDDLSTDKTTDILEKYCHEHSNHFVFMGSDKCGGAKQNFMFMINFIEANYVMFCDQDDVWFPQKIEQTYTEMKNLEKNQAGQVPICIYSDVKLVDYSLNILSENYIGKRGEKHTTRDLLKQNVVIGCTMMANKELINAMKRVGDINNIYMHDWWGGLICSLKGKLSYINEPLMFYRQHENNAVGAKLQKDFLSKLHQIISWKEWCNEKREWLERPRKMAKELKKIIPEDHPQYYFLKEFASIGRKNKIYRIMFYIKNGMIITESNILFQLMFI